MKGEREVDNFLSEKPQIPSNDNNGHYHQQMLSSCSSSNGFCFSDVGSSSIPSFDQSGVPLPKPHFVDHLSSVGSSFPESWCANGRANSSGLMLDELGLARKFHMMNIGDRTEFSSDIARLDRDPEMFRISDCNVPSIRPSNGQNFGSSESFINEFSGHTSGLGRRGYNIGDSLGLMAAQNQSRVPNSGHGHFNCSINFPFEETNLNRSNGYLTSEAPFLRVTDHTGNGGLVQRGDGGYSHATNSMFAPLVVDDPLRQYMVDDCKRLLNPWGFSQNLSMYSDEALLPQAGMHYMGGLTAMDPSQLNHYRQAFTRGDRICNSMIEKMRVAEEREGPKVSGFVRKGRQFETYGCESAFMMKEKELIAALGKNFQSTGRVINPLAGTAMQKIGGQLQSESTCGNGSHLITCDPAFSQSIYNSFSEIQGNIYLMAKDQHGCRFLQKKFDKGSFDDVQLIFNEIIEHVVELMINPFGNYLIQKLLDVCNEEQRMRIVHAVTKDRGALVRICLNTHGTRVVQKLIESLKTKKQISLVIRALEPGFLDLIKDLNGNHVVQRCLQCLSTEDNKFIFDSAAKFCVEIATHRHGCCVLQRCIAHSSGEHQKKVVEEICRNGLHLAQDPFGNYVVQYIIELRNAAASGMLRSEFEGHYVHLSTQKFSSHVVEKCLKLIEESQSQIVYELLSMSHFEQLLQDPYANYVIQSALEVTKGPLKESLVAAVRPHSMLRTNPYCKKIFGRCLLKK